VSPIVGAIVKFAVSLSAGEVSVALVNVTWLHLPPVFTWNPADATTSVPAVIDVAPVYVFAPFKLSVPVACLVNPPPVPSVTSPLFIVSANAPGVLNIAPPDFTIVETVDGVLCVFDIKCVPPLKFIVAGRVVVI